VTEHMLANIFDLFFNKESHYGELVREFRFILCMRPQAFTATKGDKIFSDDLQ
jgi:hypothetical protein